MLLTIGNRNYSTWSLRAWLGLRLAGLDFEIRVIPMGRPESRQAMAEASPTGAVPVLEVEGVKIWDSLAICEYAAELASGEPLWPREPLTRAVARAVTAEMHDGYRGLRWNLPMNLRRPVGPTELGEAEGKAVAEEVARVSARWRDCRRRFGQGGPFLFGEISLADAFYAPLASRLQTYALSLEEDTHGYVEALLRHPLVEEWCNEARGEPWVIEHSER